MKVKALKFGTPLIDLPVPIFTPISKTHLSIKVNLNPYFLTYFCIFSGHYSTMDTLNTE